MCGVYLRPSGGRPMRWKMRSCSACSSLSAGVASMLATMACGLPVPSGPTPVEPQAESGAPDAVETLGDRFGLDHVDVADEAQRQVVVVRIDPARPRQAAPQHGQPVGDLGGDLDAREQAWHG